MALCVCREPTTLRNTIEHREDEYAKEPKTYQKEHRKKFTRLHLWREGKKRKQERENEKGFEFRLMLRYANVKIEKERKKTRKERKEDCLSRTSMLRKSTVPEGNASPEIKCTHDQ